MSNNRKKKKRNIIGGKIYLLMLLIAILVFIITIVISSYSWFSPQVDTNQYKNIRLTQEAPLRSETCSFKTYVGTMGTDGIITYGDEVSSTSYTVPRATTDSSGNIIPSYKYFKTEVINTSYDYPSCISMFFSTINSGVNIGVISPSNSYRTVGSNDVNSFYLIRNAYVKVKIDTDVDGPGLLAIEWFVRNDSTSSSMSITPSNLYLVYN